MALEDMSSVEGNSNSRRKDVDTVQCLMCDLDGGEGEGVR